MVLGGGVTGSKIEIILGIAIDQASVRLLFRSSAKKVL